MRFQGKSGLALLAMAALAPASAWAGTDTASMAVSATVVASCDVSANAMAFGSYDPVSSTPLDSSTTLSVICTNGTGYEVSMNAGSGSGATIAARRMTGSSATLNYSLYRDSNRTNVWGATTGSNVVTGTGSGAAQSLNVYGRVPVNQTAPAGAYSDTVTVTVTW